MELNHKKYYLALTSLDLTGQDPDVIVNEENRGIKLSEVCKKIRGFSPGVIEAYSILEYYQVTKEGTLEDKDGNQIYLSTENNPQILFKEIDDPFAIYPEIEVTRNYVRDCGLLMKLVNTELTITGLSKTDKQALSDERSLLAAEEETKLKEAEALAALQRAEEEQKVADEARRIADEEEENKKKEAEAKAAEESARLAEEESKKAEAEAEVARKAEEDARIAEEESKIAAEKARKQAEKDAIEKKKKDMADSEFFLNELQYKSAQKKYAKLGYVESVKDGYHFFYGESYEEKEIYPFALAEREYGFYEQLSGGIVDENEKTAEFEFTEGDVDKSLIFNIAKETFIITEVTEDAK